LVRFWAPGPCQPARERQRLWSPFRSFSSNGSSNSVTPSGILERYSIGVGDRFGCEGEAQLRALTRAHKGGVLVTPVWNKSFREHSIIGSTPAETRRAVDAAVLNAGWKAPYYVDADHINMKTVDLFLSSCDFFTIDVADYIGRMPDPSDVAAFHETVRELRGRVSVPGLRAPLEVSDSDVDIIAKKYLWPVKEAGRIGRRIREGKGETPFVTEVSFDEAFEPQTPKELLFILAAIAWEGIPIQTIAPKFSGKFLKGIDYVGSPGLFAQEFEDDVHVIAFAVKRFRLPSNLKMSVHSGSDKFSLYPIMGKVIRKLDAGLHLKTAGTTWLEEVIGLASAGGSGLMIAKTIYRRAYDRVEELSKPYKTVIEIDRRKLPLPATVDTWSGTQFASALRHDAGNPAYNIHFRQLLHIGFKVAAEMGKEYLEALTQNREAVARNVSENLWERHLRPLFLA
jgi:hypothetical protein